MSFGHHWPVAMPRYAQMGTAAGNRIETRCGSSSKTTPAQRPSAPLPPNSPTTKTSPPTASESALLRAVAPTRDRVTDRDGQCASRHRSWHVVAPPPATSLTAMTRQRQSRGPCTPHNGGTVTKRLRLAELPERGPRVTRSPNASQPFNEAAFDRADPQGRNLFVTTNHVTEVIESGSVMPWTRWVIVRISVRQHRDVSCRRSCRQLDK